MRSKRNFLFMPLLIGLLCVNNLQAQDVNIEGKISDETVVVHNANDTTKVQEFQLEIIVLPDENKVLTQAERMPQFPGGEKEMMKYLSQNIKYPVEAQKEKIQGTVVLRFVVDKSGKVTDVVVVRSLDPSCDEEAVRVMSSMPRWIPGKQNGKEVNVYYTIPIRFRLPDKTPNNHNNRNMRLRNW